MITIYMDENVHGGIVRGLLLRGVDVLTAVEDGYGNTPDPQVLKRAGELFRLLVSHDRDMLIIADEHMKLGLYFAGVAFAPLGSAVGPIVDTLELIAKADVIENYHRKITYIPF